MARRLSRRALAYYATERIIAGYDKRSLVNQIAGYLIENRRTKEVDLIVRDIEATLAEHGVVVAHISSARELSEESLLAIESVLAKSNADHVQISKTVDPELLGGVVVEVPGYELDASLRRRLNLLRSINNFI